MQYQRQYFQVVTQAFKTVSDFQIFQLQRAVLFRKVKLMPIAWQESKTQFTNHFSCHGVCKYSNVAQILVNNLGYHLEKSLSKCTKYKK